VPTLIQEEREREVAREVEAVVLPVVEVLLVAVEMVPVEVEVLTVEVEVLMVEVVVVVPLEKGTASPTVVILVTLMPLVKRDAFT